VVHFAPHLAEAVIFSRFRVIDRQKQLLRLVLLRDGGTQWKTPTTINQTKLLINRIFKYGMVIALVILRASWIQREAGTFAERVGTQNIKGWFHYGSS
jgi:hypothetical protein